MKNEIVQVRGNMLDPATGDFPVVNGPSRWVPARARFRQCQLRCPLGKSNFRNGFDTLSERCAPEVANSGTIEPTAWRPVLRGED